MSENITGFLGLVTLVGSFILGMVVVNKFEIYDNLNNYFNSATELSDCNRTYYDEDFSDYYSPHQEITQSSYNGICGASVGRSHSGCYEFSACKTAIKNNEVYIFDDWSFWAWAISGLVVLVIMILSFALFSKLAFKSEDT